MRNLRGDCFNLLHRCNYHLCRQVQIILRRSDKRERDFTSSLLPPTFSSLSRRKARIYFNEWRRERFVQDLKCALHPTQIRRVTPQPPHTCRAVPPPHYSRQTVRKKQYVVQCVSQCQPNSLLERGPPPKKNTRVERARERSEELSKPRFKKG